MKLWKRKFGKSHPLILHCAAFHDLEKFLLVDIETLGLFSCPIILIGTGEFRGNEFIVKQYFAGNLREEESIIRMFLDAVREKEALITFNGRRFDVPFIQGDYSIMGLKRSLNCRTMMFISFLGVWLREFLIIDYKLLKGIYWGLKEKMMFQVL